MIYLHQGPLEMFKSLRFFTDRPGRSNFIESKSGYSNRTNVPGRGGYKQKVNPFLPWPLSYLSLSLSAIHFYPGLFHLSICLSVCLCLSLSVSLSLPLSLSPPPPLLCLVFILTCYKIQLIILYLAHIVCLINSNKMANVNNVPVGICSKMCVHRTSQFSLTNW